MIITEASFAATDLYLLSNGVSDGMKSLLWLVETSKVSINIGDAYLDGKDNIDIGILSINFWTKHKKNAWTVEYNQIIEYLQADDFNLSFN